MDERFRPIYGEIYSARTAPDEVRAENLTLREGDATLIRDAIESAEREEPRGRRLREDAKAFLAVNFQDLVIEPLRRAGVAASRVELSSDVRHDVALLVAEAESDSAGPEISGHGVVDSLSRNWSDLRISRYRLWERAE
jgi:hypothetical protein